VFLVSSYAKRGTGEFKLHLSNLTQYAKRRGARMVMLFVDHAPCHKTKKAEKFIREHPVLGLKMLIKRGQTSTQWRGW
jgi:hypothetical protein